MATEGDAAARRDAAAGVPTAYPFLSGALYIILKRVTNAGF